jgi:hypothetical protein
MQKLIRYFSLAVLLGISIYGISIVGSPSHNRMVNEDIEIIKELDDLHKALAVNFHRRNGEPLTKLDCAALNDMNDSSTHRCSGYYWSRRFEQDQLNKYEYSATKNHYKICANFKTSWNDIKMNERVNDNRYSWAENFTKGRFCFERTILNCLERK